MKLKELTILASKIVRKTSVKFPAMSSKDFTKLMSLIQRLETKHK